MTTITIPKALISNCNFGGCHDITPRMDDDAAYQVVWRDGAKLLIGKSCLLENLFIAPKAPQDSIWLLVKRDDVTAFTPSIWPAWWVLLMPIGVLIGCAVTAFAHVASAVP